MAVQLPYTTETFTEEKQDQFILGVAQSAGVQPFRVTINSITEAPTRRRLLAVGIVIDYSVRVPPKMVDNVESITARLNLDNLNANLASQGVEQIEAIVKQAREVSGCEAGTYREEKGMPCVKCPNNTLSSEGLLHFHEVR
jgi:hypothetical protein